MEEKKKRGRPPGARSRNRKDSARISLSLDRATLEAARVAAGAMGMSLTQYTETALARMRVAHGARD